MLVLKYLTSITKCLIIRLSSLTFGTDNSAKKAVILVENANGRTVILMIISS